MQIRTPYNKTKKEILRIKKNYNCAHEKRGKNESRL
jgi:hypothetical protein